MSDFAPFAKLVKAKFDEMSKGELFITANGRDVWDRYLAAFPEGTNPMFRERTEHDCECCKQFIRNIGNVVAVVDGKVTSVWDITGAGDLYDFVASELAKFVNNHPITALYRVSEKKYGAEFTLEHREGAGVHRWNHFVGNIAKQHVSDKVGTERGDYQAAAGVFERGLIELKPEVLVTVNELITNKLLYRGEEFQPGLVAFQRLQKEYMKLKTDAERNTFVWANAKQFGAFFRNTMMGSLVIDLSGVPASKTTPAGHPPLDLEDAVRIYESKAAPENYKRSKALITPAMVQDAMKTIREEGLEDALQRRHAKLSDVNVNDVLWVDNSVQGVMKGGIEGLLMEAAVKPVKVDEDKLEDITMDAFMATVLPKVRSMEVMVKNSQQKNLMSITAPVYEDSGQLFKWNNDFCWSYHGNLADSALRQQVQNLGGRVDGVLRFSHTWNYGKRNASLMDLHVFMPGSSKHEDGCHDRYPSGQRVGWNNRKDYVSGGNQDVDYTEAAPVGYVPVENITFPDMKKLKDGDYTFKIHNWQLRSPTEGGFKAEIEFSGEVFEYEHDKAMKNKEWITLAVATLKKGVFTIQHKMKCGSAQQKVWGITTETFTKVNTLMMSPNYWGENKVGNKHWFFILEGCRNDEPTRGIYNEYLGAKLDKHRKVLEVLGDKTKVQPADEQLSGVGFSSTRGDAVIVKVSGNNLRKTYKITF